MSIGVLHGQAGGIKLPFRVIGGTTQPSNPKDGTIWVKTSVPIMRTEFANGTWASGGVGLVFLAGTLGGSNPTGTNSTVWAIKKDTGSSKYIVKITLTGCKQVQGSTGNWVNLDAYRYYGGTWVQFSSTFAATINITYPAGSTCTATDGVTHLTAPDTSGTWACAVPNAGTWTVTATKGSLSKSSDVSITTSGQSASVTLSYTLNLFDSGNQYTSTTGGWSLTSGYGDVGSSVINLYTGENGQTSIAGTKNLIDISDFSTLNVTVTEQSGSCYARVVDSSGTTLANISISGTGTKMLDISSLSTAAYIRVGCSGTSSSPNTNLKVSKVWLS